MRFILQVSFCAEKFNATVRAGTVDKTIGRILEETKPEAVYFCAINGNRGAIMIINMKDNSELPRYAEPWFLHFNATIDIQPAMLPEDLKKAGLGELSKKWS